MSTFMNLHTYSDYQKNKLCIFDVAYMIIEEFFNKHPEFIEEISRESTKDFVDVKELAFGDRNEFYIKI